MVPKLWDGSQGAQVTMRIETKIEWTFLLGGVLTCESQVSQIALLFLIIRQIGGTIAVIEKVQESDSFILEAIKKHKCSDADDMMIVCDLVLLISMEDFQQFEQDFYQTGYYIDDQGDTVAYYDTDNSTSPAYYHE